MNAVGPGADRFRFVVQRSLRLAKVAHAEWRDEPEELLGGPPVAFGHDAGEDRSVCITALLHAGQKVSTCGIGKSEKGAAFVPGVSSRAQTDVQSDGAPSVSAGQCNGLESDTASVKAVIACRIHCGVCHSTRYKVEGVCTPQDDRMVAHGGCG